MVVSRSLALFILCIFISKLFEFEWRKIRNRLTALPQNIGRLLHNFILQYYAIEKTKKIKILLQ